VDKMTGASTAGAGVDVAGASTAGAGASTAGAGVLQAINESIPPALRTDKDERYLSVYAELLADRASSPLNVLELGVDRGGSTLLFARYLQRARILALDAGPPPAEFHDQVDNQGLGHRVRFALGRQEDAALLDSEIGSFFAGDQLDLVIDDASHRYRQTRASFDALFERHLRPGGLYVIEDWGCGYWPAWDDGHPNGRHGLPRLLKELVDLTALADRTRCWQGERSVLAPSQMESPIARLLIVPSVAVLVRSSAPPRQGTLPPATVMYPWKYRWRWQRRIQNYLAGVRARPR
jgi:SAM-dependent methyltransferase